MGLRRTWGWSSAVAVGLCGSAVGIGILGHFSGGGGLLGLASAQSVETFALSISVPPGLHPRSVTLSAEGRLLLRDRAEVNGVISNLGTGDQTELGVEAIAQDLYSEQSLALRDRATVTGGILSATAPTFMNDVVVQGDVLSGVSFANPGGKTFLAEWPTSSEGNVYLEPDQVQTLVPGRAYERIEVKSRSTLILPAGTYYIRDIVVHPQGKIALDSGEQPVELFVKNEFTWRGKVEASGTEFPNWMVGVVGSQRVVVEQQFKGLIVAPHAEITLARVNDGFHEGQFFGRHIEVHPDTLIKYHTSDFLSDPPAVINLGIDIGDECGSTNVMLTGEEVIDGETRYGGVTLVEPEPGCESASFCTGEEGEGEPIDVEEFFISPPFTPEELVECGPEDVVPTSDCPIDPSTIDFSTTCNNDSDCPNYLDGQLCAQACTDIYCEETERHCAFRAECGGLDGDSLGCAPVDIWHCSEPTSSYGLEDLELAIAGVDMGRGLAAPVPLGVVEAYGSDLQGPCTNTGLTAVDAYEGNRGDPDRELPIILGHRWRDVADPEIGGEQVAVDSDIGVLESQIDTKWGFKIYSRLFRWERVEQELLDLDHGYTESHAALLAVVKLAGTDFEVLDVGAKAAADICGYDANSATLIVGDQRSDFNEFGNVDQVAAAECEDDYEELIEATTMLHRRMHSARVALNAYQAGNFVDVCTVYKNMMVSPETLDCAAVDPGVLVNRLENFYLDGAGLVASARDEFINGHFVNQGSTSFDQNGTIETELNGGKWSFPVGPVTVTLGYKLLLTLGSEKHASLRSGHQVVNGKREPRLESGVSVTPNVGVDVAVTGGVGVGDKKVGVSVSATGQLQLIEAEFPMAARAVLERSTEADPRDVFASVYAGEPWEPDFSLPYDEVTHWVGDSNVGIRSNISAFDGSFKVTAKVKFKIGSVKFRKRLASWEGIEFGRIDWFGNWPIDQEWPDANASDDFGQSDDPVAFLRSELVPAVGAVSHALELGPDSCIVVK